MKKASEFVDNLQEVFRLFGSVQARSMFGGHGIYHDGVMIGLVADDTLYLKTGPDNAARFAEAGLEPFSYDSKIRRVITSYARAPDDALEDPAILRDWAQGAIQAARMAALDKAKGKKDRRG